MAREVELSEQILRLRVAEVGTLAAQHRGGVQIRIGTGAKEAHERDEGLDVAARGGAPQPALGLGRIRGDPASHAEQLAELVHRGGLARGGGRAKQAGRARRILRDPLAIQQQHAETELGRGVALRGALLQPLDRLGMIGRVAVAAAK